MIKGTTATSLSELFVYIDRGPQLVFNELLDEIREEFPDVNPLMFMTPPTKEDHSWRNIEDGPTQLMLQLDEKFAEVLPVFWRLAGNFETRFTQKYVVIPETREQNINCLIASTTNSFLRTPMNRRAWGRNPVYRENVNFEGYAHWNAAIFVCAARKYANMSDEDINLVLRVISFNETIGYRAMFAPKSKELNGINHHASRLTPEKYRDMLSSFCTNLQHAIKNHRQRTKQRYSARDIHGAGADTDTREIVDRIRHFYNKYRQEAEKIAGAQEERDPAEL